MDRAQSGILASIFVALLSLGLSSTVRSQQLPAHDLSQVSSTICFFEGPRFLDKSFSGIRSEAVCISTVMNCLQSLSQRSADGVFVITRCWNQYSQLNRSVGNSGYQLGTQSEVLDAYLQIKTNEGMPISCLERVWIIDRQSLSVAMRACSSQ